MEARRDGFGYFPAIALAQLVVILVSTENYAEQSNRSPAPIYHSPTSICLSPDGKRAYVVNQTSNSVSVLDVRAGKVIGTIAVDSYPTHAALSGDGVTLFVTSQHGSVIQIVDLKEKRVVGSIQTGHEPCGVTVSSDRRKLYVANSLSDTVSVIDIDSRRRLFDIQVGRSPRFIAEIPGTSRVIVTNGLARTVSVVDVAIGRVVEERDLGRANLLRQVVCSADGEWAFIAHVLSHDEISPLQMERGFIHSNGISVLNLRQPNHRVSLLLDRLLVGAANPWGLAITADGQRLYVSLAGVHEIAIVDVPKALRLVAETEPNEVERLSQNVEILEQRKIMRRVDAGGIGPRGIALNEAAGELLVANYFSDTVSVLDTNTYTVRTVIPLGPRQEMTLRRQGEMLFNDARLCFQQWFSCASCHQEDATVDGLNWDLPNDGVGNSKNAKSMRNVHDTPPAMWSGVRKDMDAAVAAGERFLGFLPDPENHRALLAFIGSPKRPPNPYRGQNLDSARRGEKVFYGSRCDICHPPPRYTDLRQHDVGLTAANDLRSRFDTPSLRECYRTAPYLHDGRARTLREIFSEHNPNNLHGRTRGLTEAELDDLVAYLRTL